MSFSPHVQDKFTPLFKPRSIAMVGASKDPKKWGEFVLHVRTEAHSVVPLLI